MLDWTYQNQAITQIYVQAHFSFIIIINSPNIRILIVVRKEHTSTLPINMAQLQEVTPISANLRVVVLRLI